MRNDEKSLRKAEWALAKAERQQTIAQARRLKAAVNRQQAAQFEALLAGYAGSEVTR